jgi:hypothetical protein
MVVSIALLCTVALSAEVAVIVNVSRRLSEAAGGMLSVIVSGRAVCGGIMRLLWLSATGQASEERASTVPSLPPYRDAQVIICRLAGICTDQSGERQRING